LEKKPVAPEGSSHRARTQQRHGGKSRQHTGKNCARGNGGKKGCLRPRPMVKMIFRDVRQSENGTVTTKKSHHEKKDWGKKRHQRGSKLPGGVRGARPNATNRGGVSCEKGRETRGKHQPELGAERVEEWWEIQS